MEQLLFLFFFILAFCAYKIFDLQKRLKNEQFESARLFEANDKLKVTLVKKDAQIAELETYLEHTQKIILDSKL